MTRLAILGSTGSIGKQTLQVVDAFPDKFCVEALSAGTRTDLMAQQIRKYHPRVVAMRDEKAALALKQEFGSSVDIRCGEEGICSVAECAEADTVLVAIVGIAGLGATMRAVQMGKRVALANKEALVTGGELIHAELKRRNACIYPVDSEHSAIFQCINGQNVKEVKRIILTASGGAFRDYNKEMLEKATVEDALRHPNWSMGPKITVDCATMMNKGLEVIEAHWLFGLPADRIDVVVHRESVVHSMVEFCDHAVLAQLGAPDMRLPIMYALGFPERMLSPFEGIDFTKAMQLHFAPPDTERFPALKLAYDALRCGGILPTALNAANEVAVESFLHGEIRFGDIYRAVEYTISKTKNYPCEGLRAVYAADQAARLICREALKAKAGVI